jgi:hypothetical protein
LAIPNCPESFRVNMAMGAEKHKSGRRQQFKVVNTDDRDIRCGQPEKSAIITAAPAPLPSVSKPSRDAGVSVDPAFG